MRVLLFGVSGGERIKQASIGTSVVMKIVRFLIALVTVSLVLPVTLSQGKEIWTYPVKMGDTRQTVYNKLGIPETIYENVEWFPNSGLSIEFDKFGKARLFNFKGNYG